MGSGGYTCEYVGPALSTLLCPNGPTETYVAATRATRNRVDPSRRLTSCRRPGRGAGRGRAVGVSIGLGRRAGNQPDAVPISWLGARSHLLIDLHRRSQDRHQLPEAKILREPEEGRSVL